jgi:hypothetical protein
VNKNHLTEEALQDIITRRVANTGETREEARAEILKVTADLNAGRIALEVFDDEGFVIGRRDKDGYHPNVNDPKRRGTS